MKNLLAVPILVLILTCQLFAGEPDKKFHEKCLYPTVMIQVQKSVLGKGGVGTGVIFKSHKLEDGKYVNFVLTCAHVIPDEEKAPKPSGGLLPFKLFHKLKFTVKKANYKDWSTLVDYTDFDSKVVYKDLKRDFAILVFESKEAMPIADLAPKAKLYIGNDVFRVGCGMGDFMRVDYGKITAIDYTLSGRIKDVYRTSIPTIGGDSGGPMFNEEYQVVGIAEAIRSIQSFSKSPLSQGFLVVPIQHPICHISYSVPLSKMGNLEEHCQKKITEILNPPKEVPQSPKEPEAPQEPERAEKPELSPS